jgi:BASS family bile acid:Na+ symporter
MRAVAAVVPAVPNLTRLYFAAAQFPIYLVPVTIVPLVSRLLWSRLPGG